jgi:hypothetical protein
VKSDTHTVCLDLLSFDILLCSLDGVDSLSCKLRDRRGHYKQVRNRAEDKTLRVPSGTNKSLRFISASQLEGHSIDAIQTRCSIMNMNSLTFKFSGRPYLALHVR